MTTISRAKLVGLIAPTLQPLQQGLYLHALTCAADLCGDGATLTWNSEYLRGQAELIAALVGIGAMEDVRAHVIADIWATHTELSRSTSAA
jgi:hypothetical protein